jgi:hypothetical protein
LIPQGIVQLRICLPVHGGLDFTIAGIGTEINPAPTTVWTRIPVKERIPKGELADSTEAVLYNTHDRFVGDAGEMI